MKDPWRYYAAGAACVLAWIALSLVGIWVLSQLREILLVFLLYVGAGIKITRVIDRFGLVFLGLVWTIAVVVLESYLRSGLRQRRLGIRIVRIGAVEAGLAGLCCVFRAVLILPLARGGG